MHLLCGNTFVNISVTVVIKATSEHQCPSDLSEVIQSNYEAHYKLALNALSVSRLDRGTQKAQQMKQR